MPPLKAKTISVIAGEQLFDNATVAGTDIKKSVNLCIIFDKMVRIKSETYDAVPSQDNAKEQELIKKPKGFGARHTQALVLFLCLSIAYLVRAQLSVTMVAMTRSPDETDRVSCTDEDVIPRFNDTKQNITNIITDSVTNLCDERKARIMAKRSVYQTYEWSESTRGMIMFSFFVGYTTMMIPSGLFAQKYGGKIPILFALMANGILSIMTPWMPMFGGWVAVCVARLLQGASQAAMYPSVHTILGKWAPLSERGRLSTYIYSGSQFGTILAFQVSGLLAGSPMFGWPVTFWLCGVACFACFGLLFWLGAASPHDHPTISMEELIYITGDGNNADVVPKRRRIPWKHILTSKAVWGLIATGCGSTMSFLFILTETPLYLNRVLHVDIKRNGLYSSLPYIAMYFMTLFFGFMSDFIKKKGYLSVVNIRRTANTIGMFVSGMFMVAFSQVHSTPLAVMMLIFCQALHSGVHVGFHINQIDMAPNFAGPLMALGNMVANLCGLTVPVLVNQIVGDDVENQHKWQITFIVIFSIMTVTNLIFVVFAKGEVQSWNFYDEDVPSEKCEKEEMNLIKISGLDFDKKNES